jgi:organic radical activating enzyme
LTQNTSDTDIQYPVMEHFYTLQGEGAFAGQAAYFIRLGGCDVGCVWCDVKESWDADVHPKMTVSEIIAVAQKHPGRIAVITGGEPSMHALKPLTDALHHAGFRTHVETSASSPLTGDWDWVTLSPKKFKAPLEENMRLAHELKIIVFNKSDFKWAEDYAALVPAECKLYLQTEWDKREEMSPLIIEFIQQNPRWQLSMQTHKYLNIP